MIAGNITLEDTYISFELEEDNTVTYRVRDRLTHENETKNVNGHMFMTALGIALSLDGEVPEDEAQAWEDAECVQPNNRILRFIP